MRLQNPETKVIVRVDDTYAEELVSLGWKSPAEDVKATPTRKQTVKPE